MPEPRPTTGHRRAGLALVLAAAILWSSGGLFIKWVDADVLVISIWRSSLAALTIFVLLRPSGRAIFARSRLNLALAASYAVMLLLFVAATRNTTAANAIFLQYTAPLYVLLLGGRIVGEQPSGVDVAATLGAFAGMALFFVGRLDADAVLGNAFAIGSGMALAVFFMLLRHPSCTAETRPASMILGNLLLLAVVAPLAVARDAGAVVAPGWADAAGLAFLGIVQIGVAYVLFGRGIAHIPALEASLVGMLEPVLNPLWVYLVLGEEPGGWAIAGATVIIACVTVRMVVVSRREPRNRFGLAGPALEP